MHRISQDRVQGSSGRSGGETERVGSGDCVFIPSGESHGLENDGQDDLVYFSAAAPSFAHADLHELWPLASEAEEDRG